MEFFTNKELCKIANRFQLELMQIGHANVTPSWQGSITSPVHSRLYYITRGSFYVITPDKKKTVFTAGSWHLIPAGYSYSYGCTEEMEQIYIHFKFCGYDGTDQLRNCATPLSMNAEQDPSPLFLAGLKSENTTQALRIQQLIYGVLLSFIEEHKIRFFENEPSVCVVRAIQYIRQNLSARLTVPEIAENASVSKSTLTKCFKKELSMSVKEYLFALILTEAEHQLRDSKKSIQDISEQLGFSDQFYFSRKFKEKFKKSPREYRKSAPSQL